MPEAEISGDLFKAEAGQSFEGEAVDGRIGARAGAGFVAAAAVDCHQAGASLAGSAEIELNQRLRAFVAAAEAEVEGSAGGGVKVNLRLSPDLFEGFGLTAETQAYVQAAVAARLGIGLQLRDVITAAEGLARQSGSDVTQLDVGLLTAFLREVEAGGGVWARLGVSLAAQAYVLATASFAEADAGFAIEAGAGAGFVAGVGYDAYTRLRFVNLARAVNNAADLVAAAVGREASRRASSMRSAGESFALVLPVLLNSLLVLGQDTARSSPPSDRAFLDTFVTAVGTQSQRYLADKAAVLAVEKLLDQARRLEKEGTLTTRQQRALELLLNDAGLDAPLTRQTLPRLTDGMQALDRETRRQLRAELGALWTATALGYGLREGVGEGLASRPIPDPPTAVKEAYRQAGLSPAPPAASDGVRYLLLALLGPWLRHAAAAQLQARITDAGAPAPTPLSQAASRLADALTQEDGAASTALDDAVSAAADLDPDEAPGWTQAIGAAWTVLSLLDRVDQQPLSVDEHTLAAPPAPVAAAYEAVVGRSPTSIAVATAVDYLLHTAIPATYRRSYPRTWAAVEMIAESAPFSPGTWLVWSLDRGAAQIAAPDLIAFVRDGIATQLLESTTGLLPVLDGALPGGSQTRLYIREVVQPLLLGAAHFVLVELERIERRQASLDDEAFRRALRQGMGALLYKVVARYLVVTVDVVLDFLHASLSGAFRQLEREVRTGGRGRLIQTVAPMLQRQRHLPVEPLEETMRTLLADLAELGARLTGDEIWHRRRHRNLRRHVHILLSSFVPDERELAEPARARTFFRALANCVHVPKPRALVDFSLFLADLAADSLAVALDQLGAPLRDLFFELAQDGFRDVARGWERAVEAFERSVAALQDLARDAQRKLREARDALVAVVEQIEQIWQEVRAWLADQQRRSQLINLLQVNALGSGPQFVTQGLLDLTTPLLQQGLAEAGETLTQERFFEWLEESDTPSELRRALRRHIDDHLASSLGGAGLAANIMGFLRGLLVSTYMQQIPSQLNAAIRLEEQRVVKSQALEGAVDARDSASTALLQGQRQRNALRAGQVRLEIENPRAFSQDSGPERFPRDLLLRLRLRFPIPVPDSFDAPRAVFVALNGRRLSLPNGTWQKENHSLLLSQRLDPASHPALRPGVNSLTCAVGASSGGQHRLFVLDPDGPPDRPVEGQTWCSVRWLATALGNTTTSRLRLGELLGQTQLAARRSVRAACDRHLG